MLRRWHAGRLAAVPGVRRRRCANRQRHARHDRARQHRFRFQRQSRSDQFLSLQHRRSRRRHASDVSCAATSRRRPRPTARRFDSPPIAIVVDALPSGKTTLSLSANVTGSVNWQNMIVIGNGHTVHPNGIVTIKDSVVTGLGTPSTDGINGIATALDIENTVFESTGAVTLTVTQRRNLQQQRIPFQQPARVRRVESGGAADHFAERQDGGAEIVPGQPHRRGTSGIRRHQPLADRRRHRRDQQHPDRPALHDQSAGRQFRHDRARQLLAPQLPRRLEPGFQHGRVQAPATTSSSNTT